jgi:hypothetical protein
MYFIVIFTYFDLQFNRSPLVIASFLKSIFAFYFKPIFNVHLLPAFKKAVICLNPIDALKLLVLPSHMGALEVRKYVM